MARDARIATVKSTIFFRATRLRAILLGHSDRKETAVYLQLSQRHLDLELQACFVHGGIVGQAS